MNDLSDGKWSSAFTTLKQLFFSVSKTRCMNCLNGRNEPSSTSEHTSDLCVVMTKTKVLGWVQTGTLLMCQNTMCSICNPNPKRMAQIGVPRNKDDLTGNSIPRDRKVFLNGRWGKYRENKMKQNISWIFQEYLLKLSRRGQSLFSQPKNHNSSSTLCWSHHTIKLFQQWNPENKNSLYNRKPSFHSF